MARILNVVGARPNFMKIAPILEALKEQGLEALLLHTGQHYDEAMNDRIFADLGLPLPDFNLSVGSGSHAWQTAEIMQRFEPVLLEQNPDAVLVVGDVNSTIACSLVAAKLGIEVIHVEAGLRSYDRTMPEEINRVLTDQLSDLLFTTEIQAAVNLRREGIAAERIHFVGNVMIDTLMRHAQRATPPQAVAELGDYALVTLHRPSNVDDARVLDSLVDCLVKMASRLAMAFPCHPRTLAKLKEFGLLTRLEQAKVVMLPPQGYLEMLGLTRQAKVVVTDSGGLQEETTALGVPCITVRDNTERPITITQGTNTLAGTDPDKIMSAFDEVLAHGGKRGRRPELWDGCAAQRIAQVLRRRYS